MVEIDVAGLKTTEEREEWVLSVLPEKDFPMKGFFEVVKMQAEDDDLECADGWLELLIDELAEREDRAAAMLALNVRARMFDDGDGCIRNALHTQCNTFSMSSNIYSS